MQVDAILELKLYKLAKLGDPDRSSKELKEKRAEAKRDRGDPRATTKKLLERHARTSSTRSRRRYADKRRTKIGGAGGEDVEFDAEDFIVDEDAR